MYSYDEFVLFCSHNYLIIVLVRAVIARWRFALTLSNHMDYISAVTGSFNMASPLNFEPYAPPSEWRLDYVFPISAMLICASLTHKYSQPKNANWLDFALQLCPIFVDSAHGSQHVSFIELCACRGIQLYTNNTVFVIKSATWRI